MTRRFKKEGDMGSAAVVEGGTKCGRGKPREGGRGGCRGRERVKC